jgi:hypothetical protein
MLINTVATWLPRSLIQGVLYSPNVCHAPPFFSETIQTLKEIVVRGVLSEKPLQCYTTLVNVLIVQGERKA